MLRVSKRVDRGAYQLASEPRLRYQSVISIAFVFVLSYRVSIFHCIVQKKNFCPKPCFFIVVNSGRVWCLVVRSFCRDLSWCLCLKFCFRIHRFVCWLAVSCPARKTKKLVVATRVLILFVSSNAALFLSHNLSRNSVRCVLLCIASLITSSLLQVCPSASCSVPSFLAFNFCPKLLIVASQICAPLFLSYLTCILGFQN